MRLSCSASAFFSSSATSNIASFATYSTSCSLIFIGKRDFLDPGSSPGLVHLGQQLRCHLNELSAPDLIRHVNNDPRTLDDCDARQTGKLRPDQLWPQLAKDFEIELSIPIR